MKVPHIARSARLASTRRKWVSLVAKIALSEDLVISSAEWTPRVVAKNVLVVSFKVVKVRSAVMRAMKGPEALLWGARSNRLDVPVVWSGCTWISLVRVLARVVRLVKQVLPMDRWLSRIAFLAKSVISKRPLDKKFVKNVQAESISMRLEKRSAFHASQASIKTMLV
jgi:hypothetical protein